MNNIGFFKCQICKKCLSTAQGLKSHTTRLHRGSLADQSSQQPEPVRGQVADSETDENSFAEFLAKQRCTVKVIKRIPKGARTAAAEAFSDCIQSCLQDNNFRTWKKLLMFAGICLQIPTKTNSDLHGSLTTSIKRNITIFQERSSAQSTRECVSQLSEIRTRKFDENRFGSAVEAKIADGDVVGAIRLLESEDSLAPFDEETYQTLLTLHPSHEGPMSWPDDTEASQIPRIQVTVKMIKDAIVSFQPGSAGGLDMLRPQHLKDMVGHSTGAAGERLLSSLTSLCSLMLEGKVPSEICPILYGASLCALKKKEGGIRPIAVGSTLRRLVAKVGGGLIKHRMGEVFQSVQLGFGVRGGAEVVAHTARRFVSFHHKQPKVLLKIDFENAFNSVRRDVLLQAAMDQFPELFPFLSQCYRNPTHLYFGEYLIPSQRGIQQGDPLGTALFCAAVQKPASSLTSELNLWYLDDATLGDSPDKVCQDLEAVIQRSSMLGLKLNFKKCELFPVNIKDEEWENTKLVFQTFAPGICFQDMKNCKILGVPLHIEGITKALEIKTSSLRRISTRLSCIKSHIAFFILKNCLSIPKLTYLLRCAPTWKDTYSLEAFDNILKEALGSVVNIQLQEDAWTQASLPVKLGGLGIRHAKDLALPAFLASVSFTAMSVEKLLPIQISATEDLSQTEGVELWRNACEALPPSLVDSSYQKNWESPVMLKSKANLEERATNLQDKARLVGVSSKESGAFLHALPSAPLGTLLDDNSFRISIALRLGAPICEEHTCVCGKTVGVNGLHGLSCARSGGRMSRHAAVNDLLKRGLVSAGIPAVLEPTSLSRENNLRPDGVTQIPWKGGKAMAWDFTCVDSQAECYLQSSSVTPLYAATEAEKAKHRKYVFLQNSHIFCPIATECLGSMGKDSFKLIREIGKKITGNTGEKRAGEFLFQRISLAIQRGNAAAIMATIPRQTPLEELFCLL